jgi:Holliday junction DNA helicase RuvA
MIARLRGVLLEAGLGRVVVEAGGVGYEVHIAESTLRLLPQEGEQVDLYTRQLTREDGSTLYGFLDPFQRTVFDMLMEVKGCGPKTGLGLLGEAGAESVCAAILAGDTRALARAPGVGPRLAARIALELKERVEHETLLRKLPTPAGAGRRAVPSAEDEVVEALMALGYRRQEAERAAAGAHDGAGSVEDRLKLALRELQR